MRQLGEKTDHFEEENDVDGLCIPEKALDRGDGELLWQVLESYGVRERLRKALKSLYIPRSEAYMHVGQGRIQTSLLQRARVRDSVQCHPGCLI